MELRHLQYFLCVAEELHFRKAASKLFISQPPLSRQIKELEEELGVVLLIRNNKTVTLTEAGKYFKKEAERILSLIAESKNIVKQIHDSVSGQLRIGYISSSHPSHLSDILKEMRQCFPFVKTKLYEVPTVQQVKALEEGKLDIGIMRAPAHSDKLKVISLKTDPFVVAIPGENHAFKDIPTLGAYLKHQPFIFFNHEYAPEYFHMVEEICQRMGFNPDIVHEANNVHSILRLVDGGLGVTIIPKPSKEQYSSAGITFYDLNSMPIVTEMILAYKSIEGNPAAKWFMERYSETLNKD